MLDKTRYGYVYETTDSRNGKLYIGQCKGPFNPDYHGSGRDIVGLCYMYGASIFNTRLLEYADSREKLSKLEREYIKFYRNKYGEDNVYNIDGGPSSHRKGCRCPWCQNRRGEYRLSEDAKSKLRGPFSEEHRINLSRALSGRKLTKAHKENVRRACLGKKRGLYKVKV